MKQMIDVLGASEALSLETALAVVISIAVTILFMVVFRRIKPIQRIVLPGLDITRKAQDKADAILDQEKCNAADLAFVGNIVRAYAVRGAASLVLAALVFMTVMTAVAPLFAL